YCGDVPPVELEAA
ncbi:hypothetical protein LDH03_18865, partial [Mycobacterium tuberculosis]